MKSGFTQAPDWLTVAAITALAISLNVGIHETVHGLTCLGVQGKFQQLSALYVVCETPTLIQEKIVDGAAPIFNLLAGTVIWLFFYLYKIKGARSQFFWWLFMLMNWLYGAGYFMFSGISNVGDIATLIRGWEPHWLWRMLVVLIGTGLFMFFVWLSLGVFGKLLGGDSKELLRLANHLGLFAYAVSLSVIIVAALLSPLGPFSLPSVAGVLAVAGSLSPLLWMMQWFKDQQFSKSLAIPLHIQRSQQWRIAALVVTIFYLFVLGRTLYF